MPTIEFRKSIDKLKGLGFHHVEVESPLPDGHANFDREIDGAEIAKVWDSEQRRFHVYRRSNESK